MPSQHRKHRGMQTQKFVADYLKQHGFPFAESAGAGRSGSDITGVPGLDIECKARRSFNPSAAMKQQAERAQAGVVPFAVLRLDGQGPAAIEDWPVVIRLSQFIEILREAGWGDPL